MAGTNETDKHDSSTLWRRVDKHGDQISELTTAIAKTDANLATLAASVKSGFDELRTAFDGFATRYERALERLAQVQREEADARRRPVNWGWLLSGIFGLLVVFGGYSVIINRPNEIAIDMVTILAGENARELRDRAFTLGKQSADIEWLKTLEQRQYDISLSTAERTSHLEGQEN